MSTQSKVALNKQEHPERFCPAPHCLWKTARFDREAGIYSTPGGLCPRHKMQRLGQLMAVGNELVRP